MAASVDVTVSQDGGQGNGRLHPYLLTLVRWCVSCVWNTATVLLQRLLTTPLLPITGPKPVPARGKVPKRAAGTEHLHPEPRVECQLLHHPATHTMDVIFVHGLYGSLGNTWRQGDWRQKYILNPKIVTLRDHSQHNTCKCQINSHKNHKQNENKNEDTTTENSFTNHINDESDDTIKENPFTNHIHNKNKSDNTKTENNFTNHMHNDNKCDDANTDLNDSEMSYKRLNEELAKKVIPEETDLITEQFYNNTLKDQVIDNYDTQAKFVRDMFKKETGCDTNKQTNKSDNRFKCDDDFKCDYNEDAFNVDNDFKCDEDDNDYKCKYNEVNDFNECKCEKKACEVGCGCICNDCYSSCWPRDWIKMDFPGARVISINYTSDPYLWRPLWIKENKRLNLYQRAEQMIDQLLEMGVGERPIVWVGHSKGGLFIKQIYCEAYDAYMKTNKNHRTNDETKEFSKKMEQNTQEKHTHNGITADNIDTIIGHFNKTEIKNNDYTNKNGDYTNKNGDSTNKSTDYMNKNVDSTNKSADYMNKNDDYTNKNADNTNRNDNHTKIDNYLYTNKDNNECVMNETVENENVFEQISAKSDNNDNLEYVNVINDNIRNLRIENGDGANGKPNDATEHEDPTSSIEECWSRRASLWSRSRGFMFYSVPHRGSPLADIKTPVTARSVDLLEIAKDCPLVLQLQARWEVAMGRTGSRGPPAVRSVVETCRTLMSVLWLRIVSTDSADAGVGTLSGISVDHREICKPTSRSCRLYTMLTDLIHDALACSCH